MKLLKSLLGTEPVSIPFITLIVLLIATFLMGGSSRPDVESLIILRSLSVIACGIAILNLQQRHLLEQKILISIIAGFFSLHIVYLLPLFEYHDRFANIGLLDRIVAMDKLGYPLSISPSASKNGFFAIILPISVALLALQIGEKAHVFILKTILILGGFSCLLGLLQILSGNNVSFYLYRITNVGSPVGLFANRNHQAVFIGMLFPMLAAYASLSSRSDGASTVRNWTAISGGAILVPLILITGSRAGLLVGITAIAGAFLLYSSRRPRHQMTMGWKITAALSAIAGLGVLTIGMSRAEAWDRLFSSEEFGEGRRDFWALTGNLIGEYLPTGTGPGGFSAAFAAAEQVELLDSTYLNHAHNDWLEWAVNFGMLGILFLFIVVVSVALVAVRKWTSTRASTNSRLFFKLGLIVILLTALASIGDYPVRTPIISCIFALAFVWVVGRNFEHRHGGNKNEISTQS